MDKKIRKPSSQIQLPSSRPDPSAFQNHQIDLFQTFLCNTDEDREKLSNTIDLWDSIPRYSMSQKEMNKRRSPEGILPPLSVEFEYRGQAYVAVIEPARIAVKDGAADYYPGANEELVEDALRKIAARRGRGFFDKPLMQSGVAFSLNELRAELAEMGHAKSYQQITRSLGIMQRSRIEIRLPDGGSFVASHYLPLVAAVSRKQLEKDPEARWLAQFHPLIAQSIDQLAYRQFNYTLMMSLPTQLSRWIHKQLSIKFTFAGLVANPFEMRYSTIKRDSALLNNNRERDNVRDVDEAFAKLVESGILREVQKAPVTAPRGQVIDAVYRLYPSIRFVGEMKAANKRLKDASQ
ncbi:hypothetical protein MYXO_03384 [Myxococcaceae bacterium]|nr:hypothetical protein MYXO_03384 [Myxococcaceae bacterium]